MLLPRKYAWLALVGCRGEERTNITSAENPNPNRHSDLLVRSAAEREGISEEEEVSACQKWQGDKEICGRNEPLQLHKIHRTKFPDLSRQSIFSREASAIGSLRRQFIVLRLPVRAPQLSEALTFPIAVMLGMEQR